MSVLAGGRDRDRRSKGPKPEAGTGTGGTVAEDRQVESDGDRKARTGTGGRKDRRLRSPMQEQKRRGWQRLTP